MRPCFSVRNDYVKDVYPELPTLPQDSLVPGELQPEYLEPAGVRLGEAPNVGLAIVRGTRPDATAVVHHESGRSLTFGDLARQSARLANVLEAGGIEIGDRVAIRS